MSHTAKPSHFLPTNKDTICQVYAGQKSRRKIDLVLSTFIPGYEELDLGYASKPDDEGCTFKTEDEMINYFIENTNLTQTFYWNKYHDNPHKIMVGANITTDDKLIISLTFDGDAETEKMYLDRLKEILESTIGVITYFNPAYYNNGRDFVLKYG